MEIKVAKNAIYINIRKFEDSKISLVEISLLHFISNNRKKNTITLFSQEIRSDRQKIR